MADLHLKKWLKKIGVGLFLWSATVAAAFAALPFEKSANSFLTSLMAWLSIAASCLLVITCLMLAFGEWGDGFKKFLGIMFWLSLAFGVTSVVALVR